MSKLKDIIQGWSNVIWENPEIEALALERATVCSTCPTNINNVCSSSMGGCGCPIIAATRAPYKKCPKGRWKS
jgi:hypothetical protein